MSWSRARDRGAEARHEYRYDPLGQLLARLPEKAQAELFRYDATGNVHESTAARECRGAEYGPGRQALATKGTPTTPGMRTAA